ncbi:hypothetical protein GCM10020000_64970 [Streptomyces olivoverticillatus]
MADRPVQRKKQNVTRAHVVRTERLTPHMMRVVLGGEGLAEFGAGTYTDHYVKLFFPVEGVTYPEPFDIEAVRRDLPREQWPRTRTYTVRSFDRAAGELTIDFVVHGDEGLAGPWALRVRPGEEILFRGPGGAYAPDPAAELAPAGRRRERAARHRGLAGADARGGGGPGLRRGRRRPGGAEAGAARGRGDRLAAP